MGLLLPLDLETAIVLACGAFVALILCIIAYAMSEGAAGRRFRRRLAGVRDRAQGVVSVEAVATRSLARQQSATPRIDRIARQWLPRRDVLAQRLARTGRAISVGHYAMTMLGLALLVAISLACATRIGVVASLVVGLLVGIALPHKVVGRMGKRRVAAFVALFPEGIDLMVRALRSGLPISEAIIGAGHEIGGPVGQELGRVEGGMRMGRDLEGLLWDIATRIDVPEFRFFIIALSVQRETGGNLAETLANLGDVLRRRRQMRAKVRAMSSETRATTMILGGMPVLVIVMLTLTSPHYLTPLYTDVRGLLLDGLALTMLASGIGIMTKMARFEI
jgi:tight adherence protein B